MITDLDLALACQATYNNGPGNLIDTGVTHVFLSTVGDTTVIAFEGTTDPTEWLIDFEAIPVDERTFNHADLGLVHLGWWQDVTSVAATIIAKLNTIPGPKACTGHSKGAGEALIFAAYAKTQGIVWSRVSTFGTPHPGALNGLITSKDGNDYWNIQVPMDPVPLVPPYIARPRPLTQVTAPEPQVTMPNCPELTSHHINNYTTALAAIQSKQANAP